MFATLIAGWFRINCCSWTEEVQTDWEMVYTVYEITILLVAKVLTKGNYGSKWCYFGRLLQRHDETPLLIFNLKTVVYGECASVKWVFSNSPMYRFRIWFRVPTDDLHLIWVGTEQAGAFFTILKTPRLNNLFQFALQKLNLLSNVSFREFCLVVRLCLASWLFIVEHLI